MTALNRATLDRITSRLSPGRVERMGAALGLFEKLDMPTTADEAWRYVDLDLSLADTDLVEVPGQALEPGDFLSAVKQRSAEAQIVDGTAVSVAATEVEIKPVRELTDEDAGRLADLVPTDLDIFSAARAAFATDGVLVRTERNQVVADPIVIDVQAVTAGASFPIISLEAGENSEMAVLLVYRSPHDLAAVVSPQVGIEVADGARVRFLAVQNFGFATHAIIHQRVAVGRDATARVGEVGLGGRLGRLDLGVLLEGSGASTEVVGLSFGEHDQTLDYRMVITHRGRNTSSDVFLKGAVEDTAQSVFTGLLKIEKDATRSSAFETNRNLVLSEGAKAHSVPNLEILCDDVVCGHGSSVGPLEAEPLYYLESRGIPKIRAERLLIEAFFREVIDRLPVAGLEAPLEAEVFGRFVQAQEAGRVA